jgi:16S rRNA (guanine527-N7)-methyltransferase
MFHVKQQQTMDYSLWFRTLCLKNGFHIDDVQIELMSRYVELLLEWNKKINLISRKDEENVWEGHILHCAALGLLFQFPEKASVADIGTGGGLPGIPLKIMCPDLSLTLIDSTKKKIDAVSDIISRLGLTDIRALWGRVEDLGNPKMAHRVQAGQKSLDKKFDFVVARAVAPLDELIRWSRLLLFSGKGKNQTAESGKIRKLSSPAMIALKGGDLTKEVEIAARLNPKAKIETVNLVFDGSAYLQANDKKAVVVQL